jgi:hypothetical protein
VPDVRDVQAAGEGKVRGGMKPIIVGESNPYGSDPKFALYPAPDGCSGHRLATLILGMSRKDYLDSFERVNLCEGKWSIRAAREKVCELRRGESLRFVLCGRKVSDAFGVPFIPYTALWQSGDHFAVIPHPSGLCRLWNEPRAFEKARSAVLTVATELVGKIVLNHALPSLNI